MEVRICLCLVMVACFLGTAVFSADAAPKKGQPRVVGAGISRKPQDAYTVARDTCGRSKEKLDVCRLQEIDVENCIFRCMSESCWQNYYGSEPLEEGEVDEIRRNLFKFCYNRNAKVEAKAAFKATAAAGGQADKSKRRTRG